MFEEVHFTKTLAPGADEGDCLDVFTYIERVAVSKKECHLDKYAVTVFHYRLNM